MTQQNTTHAVMSQRRRDIPGGLDFFPTPPWATRALFEYCVDVAALPVWEPACGDGAMARTIGEYAGAVASSDVHDYGWGHVVHDFLQPFRPHGIGYAEWIVTNPPFSLAERFVHRGLEVAERGVAMLVRTVFIESVGRYSRLFRERRPAMMAQFTERVPMLEGKLSRTATTATSYCWLVWTLKRPAETKLCWIPPCRARLERNSDYPAEESSRQVSGSNALVDGSCAASAAAHDLPRNQPSAGGKLAQAELQNCARYARYPQGREP
jgi:hypothetical protein